MARTDYTEDVIDAREDLVTDGQPITWRLASVAGGYDEVGNPLPGTDERIVEGSGLTLDFDSSEIDGTNILRGDVKVMYEATDPILEVEMTGEIEGKTYRIMNVMPFSPGGTVIFQWLQVRS